MTQETKRQEAYRACYAAMSELPQRLRRVVSDAVMRYVLTGEAPAADAPALVRPFVDMLSQGGSAHDAHADDAHDAPDAPASSAPDAPAHDAHDAPAQAGAREDVNLIVVAKEKEINKEKEDTTTIYNQQCAREEAISSEAAVSSNEASSEVASSNEAISEAAEDPQLAARRAAFWQEIVHYGAVDKHPRERLNDFFNYWSQPDRHGSLRKERMDYWNTQLRLRSWEGKEKQFAEERAKKKEKEKEKEHREKKKPATDSDHSEDDHFDDLMAKWGD